MDPKDPTTSGSRANALRKARAGPLGKSSGAIGTVEEEPPGSGRVRNGLPTVSAAVVVMDVGEESLRSEY
jgi:hypothetical protein